MYHLNIPEDLLTGLLQPILLTVAEIAGNLEIFQTLVDKDGSPCSSSELAIARKADVTLVGRSCS